MNLMDRVKAVRQGGELRRCHTFPIFGEYLNSTHQWNVMMLCHLLFPDARKELLIACATHDVAEGWAFGDVPAHAKWRDPETGQRVESLEEGILRQLGICDPETLTKEEREILSALDKLELYIWALDQRYNHGNQRASVIIARLTTWFIRNRDRMPEAVVDVWNTWNPSPLDDLPKENEQ